MNKMETENEKCLENFVEDHRTRLSLSTLVDYRISLDDLFQYCQKPYDEITQRDIRSWLSLEH